MNFHCCIQTLPGHEDAQQGIRLGRDGKLGRIGVCLLLEGDSPEEIRLALQTLMKDHSYRKKAETIGESFRRSGGAKAAADKIESCF